MGTGEETTASKPSKPTSSIQEVPTTPSYPDWSSPMQAYYAPGATPPPFFASTVASPSPHPYMWGSQHPLMPPYGTPVPYSAIYPPYVHPNMAPTPVAAQTNVEPDGKGADGRDGASAKKSKVTSGNSSLVGGKAADGVKATSGSGNDGASQSADSGSEGSSEGNEDNSQQEFTAGKKGSFDQMLADGANAQNNTAIMQVSVTGKPGVPTPATNLNIGMDLWNASSAGGAAKIRPNPGAASSTLVPTGMMPDQWMQDERELKRQRRKQSNRESARRSRLRKQVECEELQARVETLSNENHTLRDELHRLSEECEKLTSENSAIKEELTRVCGPEAVANLEHDSTSALQSHGSEENS
ncbi:G-box-binding factor 1 isoform X1 [Eucalyptus grandis]|uniref:G-box-binding factor 1 isoform X1 n=1 Tax=Eucalyptus grandis TaxID=71139 RepID=UPI000524E2DE|nr:G-box-binding factor 1 isoform X1 [Eucalyptus grandis]XP_039156607.1 G-box-binding factor 1 isoform X1 [Eucalyptus grandis]